MVNNEDGAESVRSDHNTRKNIQKIINEFDDGLGCIDSLNIRKDGGFQ